MRLVRPLGDVLVRAALDVEARELGAAQGQQRKAALVVGVDELVVRRRHGREDAEPGVGVLALERPQHALRDRAARDAVEAVAAGDDVAFDRDRCAVVGELDPRALRVEVVQRHVLDLEQERRAGVEPRGDEVLHDLGLPVDDDAAPGQVGQRDPMALAVELELDAVVDDPLALHPLADARLDEEVGGALLEHAGADALLDVLAAAGLEHDRLDPLALEQPREHQAGRARADDADLRPQAPRRARAGRSRTRRWPPARRSRRRTSAAPPSARRA